MNTPLLRAAEVYEKEVCKNSFDLDVALYLKFGYVIATPQVFLMGRPVEKGASYQQLMDLTHQFESPDCWWIFLAAGNLKEFFRYEPFPLPYFGWERSNKPRYWKRKDLIRWLNQICIKEEEEVLIHQQPRQSPQGT